ncbi:DUF6612 family protein [Facklamia hominis]|uniref:DUF6612 family protein n=1 Tax=Facklamia hominis TaxID=178214 RepID=UPI0003537737|nr:DUF6612 family protein [Facklamia hominis]EPH12151.1 hypothetical protein HMPREF9260_00717 [Facklamia hominis ACS-120-V-Sch10]
MKQVRQFMTLMLVFVTFLAPALSVNAQDSDVYDKIVEANSKIESQAGNFDTMVNLISPSDEMDVSYNIHGDYQIQAEPFAMKMVLTVTDEATGETKQVDITHVDGYTYVYNGQEWSVMEEDTSSIINETNKTLSDSQGSQVIKDLMQVSETDDSYKLTADLSQADFSSYFDEIDLQGQVIDQVKKGIEEAGDLGEEAEMIKELVVSLFEKVEWNQLATDVLHALGQLEADYDKENYLLKSLSFGSETSLKTVLGQLLTAYEDLLGEQLIAEDTDMAINYHFALEVTEYNGSYDIQKPEDAPSYEEYQSSYGMESSEEAEESMEDSTEEDGSQDPVSDADQEETSESAE